MKRPVSVYLFSMLLFSLLLGGCDGSGSPSQKALPASHTEGYTIMVACDSVRWKGALGDSLRAIFAQRWEGLPRPEAAFRLLRIDSQALRRTKTLRRSTCLVEVRDDPTLNRPPIALQTNRYASPQIVLIIRTSSLKQSLKALGQHRKRLLNRFLDAETKRIQHELQKRPNRSIQRRLLKEYQLRLWVPSEYEWAKQSASMVWLRHYGLDVDQHVFIHWAPYTTASVFDTPMAYRAPLVARHLRDSEKADLYMTHQKEAPHYTSKRLLNGHYAVQMRGLWQLSDYSIGGPFVSYLVADTAQQRLYYVEGLLSAPGKKQRRLMGELDALLQTFAGSTRQAPAR